ncbi:MAG: nucleotidyltransferase domain-containing protein [Halobacteria archaeon]
MDTEKVTDQVSEDFGFLDGNEDVLAVLVHGSVLTERFHERSDIDVCVVAPGTDPSKLMREVYVNVNTERRNYDVYTFEELSLELKHRVIEEHEIAWCRDFGELQMYFYRYRKLWNDQAKARGLE